MTFFEQLLGVLLMGFVVYMGFQALKRDPSSLSRESLCHSFTTLGLLALILILFVTLLVKMVGEGESQSVERSQREPGTFERSGPQREVDSST